MCPRNWELRPRNCPELRNCAELLPGIAIIGLLFLFLFINQDRLRFLSLHFFCGRLLKSTI